MKEKLVQESKRIEGGFFGFWVQRYKVSFLLMFLLIVMGVYSLLSIPKETSPNIKFGIILINTIYPGVSPTDMDSLITEKIEQDIKDIDGVKKITSTSSVGISSLRVELETGSVTRDVLTDIKDVVDGIDLPEDANDPSISELKTNSDLLFEVLLYGDEKRFSTFDLMQKAQYIKSKLGTSIPGISALEISSVDVKMGGKTNASDYDIEVLLSKDKLEQLGISLASISNAIKSYNKNTPIGNYTIENLSYDFRFDGELTSVEELKNVVIRSTGGSSVYLKDIASIEKKYSDDSIRKLGFYESKGYNYVSLLFNKTDTANIFSVSAEAKKELEKLIAESTQLDGVGSFYVKDMSVLITDDYVNLGNTALQTLVLVFVIILLFVGFKESLIASLLLPLSFFITFIFLDSIGYSLNFLTNFALVLTLGISIDTVIVIIEGASEKQKLGYNKKEAVLLAIREFSSPLISGTLTTLSAFLPMIFLPGIMGKFLSYIPITVFTTLLGALVLSLTVSSALFISFGGKRKTYHKDEKLERSLPEVAQQFLAEQRIGKVEKTHEKTSRREKFLGKMGEAYYSFMEKRVHTFPFFTLVFFVPIALLIASFVFLSPQIGFTLFPATDEGVLDGKIEAKVGTDKKVLKQYLPQVDKIISNIPEVKVYNTTLSGNAISVYIELFSIEERQKRGLRDIFKVEKELSVATKKFETYGLSVIFETMKNGPPAGDPVGVELIAQTAQDFDMLKTVASDLKKDFSTTVTGIKNVRSSSSESPGQFIFRFEKAKLAQLGLLPDDILREVYLYTNGLKAGSITSEYEDNDIVLKVADFEESLTPEDIENLVITTRAGKIRVGDVANYSIEKAVTAINRKDGKISITVGGGLDEGYTTSDVQPKLEEIAKSYNYPKGISYKTGGENEENADLIASTMMSMFIALFLIFSILVFQFNSFSQPVIVLFSVVLALLGVNIGLFLTGNPYSMTFAIGFIALTGVVVNDAIILVDRMNKNLAQGVDLLHSVVGGAKSRLQPIIVTTLTTVFGVLPLALQDQFWAPLGFTIIFGLIAGSTMTLFSIPTLYYRFFGKRYLKHLAKTKK